MSVSVLVGVGIVFAVGSILSAVLVSRCWGGGFRVAMNPTCGLAIFCVAIGMSIFVRVPDLETMAVMWCAISALSGVAYAGLARVSIPWWFGLVGFLGFFIEAVVRVSPWSLFDGGVTAVPFAAGAVYALLVARQSKLWDTTVVGFCAGVLCGVVPGFVVVCLGTVVAMFVSKARRATLVDAPFAAATALCILVFVFGSSLISA